MFGAVLRWSPERTTWENYLRVWQIVPFGRFFGNSVFVAVCVTAGQVLTSSMAAYAFARLRFPGRDQLFFGYVATLMIPGSVTIIPVFILMRGLGWLDTYTALIVPPMVTAYGTFLLRQFFMTLPRELEDAAKIDGAGWWTIYWRVILPLSKPALMTLGLFAFIGNWGSFMWPLLVIDSIEKKTIPIGLAYFQEIYQFAQPNWPLLMAGSVLAMLPIIVLFFMTQRYFLEGIKLGRLKV